MIGKKDLLLYSLITVGFLIVVYSNSVKFLGEFRVPVPSLAINPNAGLYGFKKPRTVGDPEMGMVLLELEYIYIPLVSDRLVENWQNNFRKLVLSGIPRAEAYRRVMGINHPPELATGHWKPQKPKKKSKYLFHYHSN